MSWISDFAGKAENLLNQLDKGAASVLKEDGTLESVESVKNSPQGENAAFRDIHLESKVQVVHEKEILPKANKTVTQTRRGKEKQEEQLMKFLNGGEASVELKAGDIRGSSMENDWQRTTNNESNRSYSPGSLTDQSSSMLMDTESIEPWDSSCASGRASRSSTETGPQDSQEYEQAHITPEENGPCDNVVSWKIDLASENKMLRQEISSLNQETTRVLARAKQAEKELKTLRGQVDSERTTSQRQRENMRATEEKLEEEKKVGQLKVDELTLKVEEKHQENLALQGQLSSTLAENQRQLSETQDISGVQSHALLAMEERMRVSEEQLRERESEHESAIQHTRKMESSHTEKIKGLELERQNKRSELAFLQKENDVLKLTVAELQGALSQSKAECGIAQKELIDYRMKAQRILQEKENFISQLKVGIIGEGKSSEETMLEVELEQVIKERNLCQEEASKFSSQLQATRQELGQVAKNLLQELEDSKKRETELSIKLQEECLKREEGELETNQGKEELRFLRDDLTRAKTIHMSKLEEKEAELKRLQNHLTIRENTPEKSRDAELRLKQLTDNLIQKQSHLESLTSEKNTMVHKIEYLERKVTESLGNLRSRKNGPSLFADDTNFLEVDRRPSFLQESPFDGATARQVKRVYTEIDKLSIRIGVALRRYPIARIFVIFYMVVLHFWVFLVLFAYTPDTEMGELTPDQKLLFLEANERKL